jgi:Transcription factor WhiB
MIGMIGLIGLESADKAGISPMSTDRPGPWRQLAACRRADPELFFPVSATGPSRDQVAEAKAICFGCQVRHQCQLAEAVDDVAAAHVLRMGITVMRDLAGMAGPVADDTITSSYRRLAVHLRAADPDAAEQEMASLLTSLRQMSRQVRLGLTLFIRDDRPGTRLASRAG